MGKNLLLHTRTTINNSAQSTVEETTQFLTGVNMGWAGWMSGWMSDDACAVLDFVGNVAHTFRRYRGGFGCFYEKKSTRSSSTTMIHHSQRRATARSSEAGMKERLFINIQFQVFLFYFSYFFFSVSILHICFSPLLPSSRRVRFAAASSSCFFFCWVSSHSPRPLLTRMVYPIYYSCVCEEKSKLS